ncbi:hypothetical protein L3Q82_005037 [Scortum barcoo]|uniref:Uncharacterized protein n=1 Tax=Scortum barcoo TaxID=214431 RepID=A0ACB8VFX6_9TELE|nr:hypothetical protein L3Q82_005037 [Scortum barcoo]
MLYSASRVLFHPDGATADTTVWSVDCVKFCGVFELALRGKDESEGFNNPGVFRCLVDLVASLDKVVKERFFEFLPVMDATSDSIAGALLDRLSDLFSDGDREKLIAQVHDGASVMRGEWAGVQQKIVARRLPRASPTRWNFNSRIVNTVYENLDDPMQCFESITTSGSFDSTTVREASGFLRMLQDEDFQFFLQLFHQIMPHVDMLYQQSSSNVPSRASQAVCRQDSSQQQQQVAVRTTRPRRALGEREKRKMSKEICDTILVNAKEHFSFTDLVSATLLQAEMFEQHRYTFHGEALDATVTAYPMLNKAKVKTELSLICAVPGSSQIQPPGDLSETVALLNILITTPMTTAEAERCFSTLKRIKTFLRNAMGQERLNALAMLSMERELVRNMPDFKLPVVSSPSPRTLALLLMETFKMPWGKSPREATPVEVMNWESINTGMKE